MTDSLLSMIQRERSIEAKTLWSDIERMREWAPCPDLPSTLGEFNRFVRALASADPPLVTADEDGLITYIPRQPVVVESAQPLARQGAFAW